LPRLIRHCGQDFDIGHLDQHTETCSWTGGAGDFSCAVKIRYSSHCWSFEHDGAPQAEGSHIFRDRNQYRVFCPIRFSHSLELPTIFRDLCEKPTARVSHTPEANWTIYRLEMPSPLLPGEKYWMFFHVKRTQGEAGLPTELSLFVESAYPRDRRPVFVRGCPFGKVIEEA
jgi:hypothetical protein